MNVPAVASPPRLGLRLLPRSTPLSAEQARDRSVRRRIYVAWGLLILNVVPFYKGTWNQLPLLIPIPSVIGKLITQGSLPLAVLILLTVNRRLLVRPSVFLTLLSLMVVEAMIASINPAGHLISTFYRIYRLGGYVMALWLLTPWAARRDLLLVRCHLRALYVVLGSVVLGLLIAPGRAMAEGRLSGEFWPITPVQVSDFAAVALGLIIVLWFCGEMPRRWTTLGGVIATTTMLLLTHTRTELIALMAGVFVAGLQMFASEPRVRKLFGYIAVAVCLAITAFSSVLITWLARGQSTKDLTNLTGRTTVWEGVLNAPRTRFQVLFGYGLSNKSFNGLPIDSNWLASYYDLGLIGVALGASCLLFVLISAYFTERSPRAAVALFLVTYLLVTSYTETGLSDASAYLLELALAASLLLNRGDRSSG